MQTPRPRTLLIAGTAGIAVAIGAALLAFALDASRPAEAQPTSPDATVRVLTCVEGARLPANTGVVVNNAWNRASAGKGPWKQCLQSRERDGRVEFGWSWSWPTKDSLYAYPEQLIGRTPWNDLASNDSRFPVSIDAVRSLRIDYDIESHSRGKKNLALEFWLTDSAAPATGGSAESIRSELMIWTDASPGMETASPTPDEIIEIDGQRWAVRARRDWGDASGGSRHKWTFITYRAMKPSTVAHYDARPILQHAIDSGWIDARYRIEGVELGNELVSGSGETWIRRFDVTVE